jgi:hypothetical protein
VGELAGFMITEESPKASERAEAAERKEENNHVTLATKWALMNLERI